MRYVSKVSSNSAHISVLWARPALGRSSQRCSRSRRSSTAKLLFSIHHKLRHLYGCFSLSERSGEMISARLEPPVWA